ncbi:MAG: LysR family transcriptional regulator [Sphingomonas sp.]|nr:LysR family transcriptional regulator [Sphingomonas sp.]MDX3884157.1 LysR family transcriptional regulator [Sphingomonas sp.]
MLDPRLLRSFVAIADSGNFTLAAHRLNMTQSTISQQLGRLEEVLGRDLIDRSARPVRLTAAGERLVGHARRILALQDEAELLLRDPAGTAPIHIGLPEDLATGAMAEGFARFMAGDKAIRLDVTTGLSRDLATRYRDGEFDLAIVKEMAAGNGSLAAFPEPLGWFIGADDALVARDPLPLVTFPPGGLYRDQMFDALERQGRRWYVAFSGSSLQSVLAAVEAGLGLSLLPVGAVRGTAVRERPAFGPVAPMAISLYARTADGAIGALADMVRDVLAERRGR